MKINNTQMLLFLLVLPGVLCAQSIKRQSIGSYGSSGTTDMQIRGQTIGQPFSTSTYSDNKLGITPGFQQPESYIKYPHKNMNSTLEVVISPNPAYSSFSLVAKEETDNAQVLISNVNGETILEKEVLKLNTLHIDCSTWQPGIYCIRINIPKKGNLFNSKIIILK